MIRSAVASRAPASASPWPAKSPAPTPATSLTNPAKAAAGPSPFAYPSICVHLRNLRIPMKKKILIVEDDPHILLGLEEVLKSEGFDIASCNRGDHALDSVAKNKPALIVLDVMLPGASG